MQKVMKRDPNSNEKIQKRSSVTYNIAMSPFVHPCAQKHSDVSAIAGSLTSIPSKIKLELKDHIALSRLFYIYLKTWYILQKDKPENQS